MKPLYSRVLVATLTLLVAACSVEETAAPAATEKATVQSVDTTFMSRGVVVPATVVTPVVADDVAVPLVVMAHGHGGSRQEGGGFEQIAQALAERGVASIRMDFPGCGDSSESFANNNLTNMLADLQAARRFIDDAVVVDPERVGLLGYSMGGRLVALLSERDPSYKTMAMWAPAVSDGAEREVEKTFGSAEAYAAKREVAEAEGSVVYTTMWGSELEVGLQWFEDIESSQPQAAIAKYPGPLLVIYGDADEAVAPAIAASAVTAAVNSSEVREVMIPTARHGLGFYTQRPDIASQVVTTTADFLVENL